MGCRQSTPKRHKVTEISCKWAENRQFTLTVQEKEETVPPSDNNWGSSFNEYTYPVGTPLERIQKDFPNVTLTLFDILPGSGSKATRVY